MNMTDRRPDWEVQAKKILEIGAEQVPATIAALRRDKALSRLVRGLNAGLASGSEAQQRTARATLDRLGFL